MFRWHLHDVNPAPARFNRQFPRSVHVDELICQEVDVKAVFLVQFEDADAL
jgi:hypothetical protein